MFFLALIALVASAASPAAGQIRIAPAALRRIRLLDVKQEERAAQSSSEDEATEEASQPFVPLFYLRDGSRVAGDPGLEAIEIQTRYGALKVPVGELIEVRLAERHDPATLREAADLISRMGSDDFDEREEAMEALRGIGAAALELVRKAAGSPNEELKNRARILLEEIEESRPSAASEEIDEAGGEEDVIIARKFSFKGEILEESFSVESRYGTLEIAIQDLVGIRFQRDTLVARSFDVPGSRSVPANWLNTKIQVTKGQTLIIRARGQVTVSNYNLVAGPEGTSRYSASYNYEGIRPLALAGRIGSKGKPFLVGPSYKAKAPAGGVLYLGVVPFRTYIPQGQFKVRVEGAR